MSSERERELREIVQEVELRNSRIQGLQEVHGSLSGRVGEVERAMETLRRVRGRSEGAETLVPVGGGVFLRAEVADPDRVVYTFDSVGVEGDVDEALEELESRREDLRTRVDEVRGAMEEEQERLKELRAEAERLASGGAGSGAVAG